MQYLKLHYISVYKCTQYCQTNKLTIKKGVIIVIIFNAVYTIFTIKRQVLQLHVGAFHCAIKFFNKLFADFSSSGKQFQILRPKDLRPFLPKAI